MEIPTAGDREKNGFLCQGDHGPETKGLLGQATALPNGHYGATKSPLNNKSSMKATQGLQL